MADKYGTNQYKQTSIKTANRGQLLLMLYEAAIRNIKRSIISIETQDIAEKGMAIGKAHDIIIELLNTLDFDAGGNIARDLERLYNFMIEQLIKANVENNKDPLIATQKILENLLEAWKEAVAQVSKGVPSNTKE